MRAVRATASAVNLTWGIDTVLPITKETAISLLGRGVAFRMGYIDLLTTQEIEDLVSVGMQVGLVTYALEFDPAHTLARLRILNVPQGATIFIDVEGSNLDPADIVSKVNAWAAAIQAAGFEAGMYVGAGCPLSSSQLSALAVTRYWHSCSMALEPARGYCMRQLRPDDVFVGSVKVDVNVIEPDYHGDVPMFCAA